MEKEYKHNDDDDDDVTCDLSCEKGTTSRRKGLRGRGVDEGINFPSHNKKGSKKGREKRMEGKKEERVETKEMEMMSSSSRERGKETNRAHYSRLQVS